MTTAICFKCGNYKNGAFNICENCNTCPESEEELAISIVMTDNYFTQSNLNELSKFIKAGGKPAFAQNILHEWIDQIRESGILKHPTKQNYH